MNLRKDHYRTETSCFVSKPHLGHFFLLRAGSLPAAGRTLALGAVEAMRSHRTHAKPAAERLGAVKLLKARSPFHSVLFALPREKLFKTSKFET